MLRPQLVLPLSFGIPPRLAAKFAARFVGAQPKSEKGISCSASVADCPVQTWTNYTPFAPVMLKFA